MVTIHNETRREAYQRQHYVYTVPAVQLIVGGTLRLEQHIVLDENHFLDIFLRVRSL